MTTATRPDTTSSTEDLDQLNTLLLQMESAARKALDDIERSMAGKQTALEKLGRVCHEEASERIAEFFKSEKAKYRKKLFDSCEIGSLLNYFTEAPRMGFDANKRLTITWRDRRNDFNPLRYADPIEVFLAMGIPDEQIEKFADEAATSYGCIKRGPKAKELHAQAKILAEELRALADQKETIGERLQSLLAVPKAKPPEGPQRSVVHGDFVILPPDPTASKISITQNKEMKS